MARSRHPIIVLAALVPALVLLPFFALPARAAGEDRAVAYVTRLSAPCSPRFEVRDPRTGQTVPSENPGCAVTYFRALHEGEQIVISGPNDWLELRFDGGRTVRLQQGNSPFDLRGGGAAASPFDNLLASLFDALRGLWPSGSGAADATAVTAVTRGQAGGIFEVPLFDSAATLRLAAGERRFTLEWNGGAPPFRVKLERDGETVPAGAWSDVADQVIDAKLVDLKPGRYQLSVRDRRGARQVARLEVVDPAARPRPPARLNSDEADADIAALAYAAWLAAEDDVWRLEAYLRARELARQYPPAGLFAMRLGEGRTIPIVRR